MKFNQKTVVILISFVYFVFGGAFLPSQTTFVFAQTASSTDDRAQLEAQLVDLESQITAYEATVASYKNQGVTLKSEIDSLNAKIATLNLKIKFIDVSLVKINRDINDNKQQITDTQDKLTLNRAALVGTLQNIYETERVSLVSILLKNPNLSDFFGEINNLLDIQSSLTDAVKQINQLQDQLLDQHDALATKKSDAAAMKAIQDAQRQAVLFTKSDKDQLLTTTKGNEQKYQQLVVQTKETAAKIRNRIFQLLGGGQLTFEKAYEFAKYAQDATGIAASFLLAVLDRESKLGANVGKCSYTTAMAPGPPASKRNDVGPFLRITAELGLNPLTTQVSCANGDGAYGGGMGPAQFIPTTWMLYRDKIAAVTGDNPPSPWKNSDAFVGTALYLKDAMSGCGSYSGDNQIRCAAARYYAGGSWSRFLSTYGSATLALKKQFDDDIAVLSGG